jgi:hypothetical protein
MKINLPEGKMMASHYTITWRSIVALALACGFSAPLAAQEVSGAATTTTRPMPALTSVTQSMLDGSANDS